ECRRHPRRRVAAPRWRLPGIAPRYKGRTRDRGKILSQLNYIAIMCDDPATMRDWYHRWLGFEEYDRTPEGSFYVTDGHFSVGLLKRGSVPNEDTQEAGLHHFGFQIDSVLDIERNLED